MIRKNVNSFINNHKLVDRIYDNLNNYDIFKYKNVIEIKIYIKKNLYDKEFITTLLNVLRTKLSKKQTSNAEKSNIIELIYDLSILKCKIN
ncbi:MAG: hypothetical protein E7166_00715 [Firmicutes bacterium]|nr:hypothetical protein [Bacillota bacterium]